MSDSTTLRLQKILAERGGSWLMDTEFARRISTVGYDQPGTVDAALGFRIVLARDSE